MREQRGKDSGNFGMYRLRRARGVIWGLAHIQVLVFRMRAQRHLTLDHCWQVVMIRLRRGFACTLKVRLLLQPLC